LGGVAIFVGDFEVEASAAVGARAEVFPVFVSRGIESGLENMGILKNARTPFFPESLGGGVKAFVSVSIRRERFGAVNSE